MHSRENINARVWAGIHFRTADVQGAVLGKKVARYLHKHYFQRVLVIATITLFASGVLMLAAGHRSRSLLQVHQLSAIVWVVVFAVHFLAYTPRVVRSLTTALRATRGNAIPGAGVRGLLVAGATGAGVALAVALLPVIHSWHGG